MIFELLEQIFQNVVLKKISDRFCLLYSYKTVHCSNGTLMTSRSLRVFSENFSSKLGYLS